MSRFNQIRNSGFNTSMRDVVRAKKTSEKTPVKWGGLNIADLTSDQAAVLKSLLQNPDKSHFITGCAGSGKTVIASHALMMMKKDLPKTVGMLVFTKALKKFVRDNFGDSEIGNEVTTYHSWSHDNPIHRDIILVDECQDFKREWVEDVRKFSGTQIWLGDDNQYLYSDGERVEVFRELKDSFPKESKFHLGTNFRNSLFVAKFACMFLRLSPEEQRLGITLDMKRDEIFTQILRNPRQSASANNQPVLLIEAESQFQEMKAISALIKDVQSRVGEQGKRFLVAHFRHETCDVIEHSLKQDGIQVSRIVKEKNDLNLPDFSNDSSVVVSTIHSAKGLEFDYVIFPMTDTIGWREEQDINNNLLYVLFTRAKKRVYCSYTNRSNSIVYQASSEVADSDFVQYVKADTLVTTGEHRLTDEEVEKTIHKHFSSIADLNDLDI